MKLFDLTRVYLITIGEKINSYVDKNHHVMVDIVKGGGILMGLRHTKLANLQRWHM